MRVAWLGPVGWAIVIAGGIGLVAYTDWRVPPSMSVSYLYLGPLVLAGVAFRSRLPLAAIVIICAALREALGPFDDTGWPLAVRTAGVTATYAALVLVVHRIQARQRTLEELAERQRRQMTRDLEEAATLQRHLIPNALPAIPGWELAAQLSPARIVAGDFYDVIEDARRGELAMVIADVGGKGAAAAMLMPVVQAAVRRLRAAGKPPEVLAAKLNAEVARVFDRPRLVSLVYLVIDTTSGQVTYVNLGHPPPLFVTGGVVQDWHWLSVGGPIAGARPRARYETGVEQLRPGDTLVLYTDGATEAENARGEPFSADRLLRVVTRHRTKDAEQVVAEAHQAIEAFRGDQSDRDDTTLLVIRARARPSPTP